MNGEASMSGMEGFCDRCGAHVSPGAGFCGSCGQRLQPARAAVERNAPAPPAPAPEPAAQPRYGAEPAAWDRGPAPAYPQQRQTYSPPPPAAPRAASGGYVPQQQLPQEQPAYGAPPQGYQQQLAGMGQQLEDRAAAIGRQYPSVAAFAGQPELIAVAGGVLVAIGCILPVYGGLLSGASLLNAGIWSLLSPIVMVAGAVGGGLLLRNRRLPVELVAGVLSALGAVGTALFGGYLLDALTHSIGWIGLGSIVGFVGGLAVLAAGIVLARPVLRR
jgi:hypothetical protein